MSKLKRQLAGCLLKLSLNVSEFETSESEEDANMACLTSPCRNMIPVSQVWITH